MGTNIHGVSPLKSRDIPKRQNNYLGAMSQNKSSSRSPPTHGSLIHHNQNQPDSSSSYDFNKFQAVQNVKNSTYGTIKSQMHAVQNSNSLYQQLMHQKNNSSRASAMISPQNSPREAEIGGNSRNKGNNEGGQHLVHMQSAFLPGQNGHKSNRSGVDQ